MDGRAAGHAGLRTFPYLPQALADLGLTPPFRSQDLWAFFDSSYRSHVDLDYFAPKWRAAGIAALHVAAWHYWERDPQADEYLRHLIEACHRNGILVYAWFELPHVSEKFWDQHPEWREKTALLQDAQLDWRKLMNLTNPAAVRRPSPQGMRDLVEPLRLGRSQPGGAVLRIARRLRNPARFTPMNDDVREEFRKQAGFDPQDLFDTASPRYLPRTPPGSKQFLDFRADLAARQQAEWIAQAEQLRKTKPHLDLTLTHVDDRFDTSMREKIGADVSRAAAAAGRARFHVSDRGSGDHLEPGPAALSADRRALQAADRRGRTSWPSTSTWWSVTRTSIPPSNRPASELFQLVHQAALSFPRVALYFENSILPADWPLLAAAASTVDRVEQTGAKLDGRIAPRRGRRVARAQCWSTASCGR